MRDIHARRPVNRTAALVISSAGDEPWTPSEGSNDSLLPIQTEGRPHWIADMTGATVGSLTVTGLFGLHPTKGPRWVVRCGCGVYSVRGQRAIENPLNGDDRCDRCRHLVTLRQRAGSEADRNPPQRHAEKLKANPTPLANGLEDLTGRTSGFLRVIGYYSSNGNGALWVVQCLCGTREVRRTRALKKRPAGCPPDACEDCRQR